MAQQESLPASQTATAAPTPPAGTQPDPPHLLRRFGLLPATALNMSNMVGAGPFITIPLLLTALNGPQAMLGWLVAFVITLCDAMIWSELGAAMPGSGGSYVYLREGFGRETLGRLMAFLFIWQFLISGPLEIASGYIGFSGYLGYLWPEMGSTAKFLVAAGIGLLNIALLYRRITSISVITVSLWVGMLLTIVGVLVTGAMRFDAKLAFDFPPGAFGFSTGFFWGLAAAARIGVYDYCGYYDICYIGEEVDRPGRNIPWSIFISLTTVAVLYVAISLSVIGVVPWRSFVPDDQHWQAQYIVSVMIESVHGRPIAIVFTLLVLWTTFGSVFALLLGYSRIPYAAALDGGFFRVFGKVHPTKHFPHVSLLLVGGLAIACCPISLDKVIAALLATRILVQFMGQIVAVSLLRRRSPELERPYRIWLYPLPNLVALVGWTFIFVTSDREIIALALVTLAAGVVFFFAWAWSTCRWPFAKVQPEASAGSCELQ